MRNLKNIIILGMLVSTTAWAQVVSPPNGTQTTSTQPTISADLNQKARNARIWVDGTEFTGHLRTRGDTVTLVPPYNLDYGYHQVQVTTDEGQNLAWGFNIVNPNDNRRGYYPNPNNGYYSNGNNGYYNNGNNGYYSNGDNRYYPNGNDGYYQNNNNNNGIDARDVIEAILPRILNQQF